MTRIRVFTALAALSAFALLLLQPPALQAEESARSIQMKPAFGSVADAGDFSESTGEQAAAWTLLVANVEDAGGQTHAAFDGPHHVLLFTTVSGRYVVRILGSARGSTEEVSVAGQ